MFLKIVTGIIFYYILQNVSLYFLHNSRIFMEYVLIGAASIIAAGLTLFSGFGLGTLLMPVFALLFPVDVAIALTAVVHLLNNLFKFILMGKHTSKDTVVRFGLPAIVTAYLGARVLLNLSDLEPLFRYQLSDHDYYIEPVKLVVAVLMVFFALFEVIPRFEKINLNKKYLPLGGIMSGFFGGLSGHQGALRSAFLLKSGLNKESFIASGIAIACMVDISRIIVYSSHFKSAHSKENVSFLVLAVLSAFLGSYIGSRLVKKITLYIIQVIVSVMLFGIAVGLGMGII